MKKLFIILLIGLLLVSCKKERTIHITAKNAATGQGYAGLGFVLRETKGYVTSSGEVQKKVYEGTLNTQGEAVFNYKLKNNRSYVLTTLVPDEELCYINNTSYTLANTDDNFKFDFRFAECAYLKLNIHNVNCIDANDYIEYRRLGLSIAETNNFVQIDGCFQYEGEYFALPMGEYKYEWNVTKGGVVNSYDSIFYLTNNQYFEFTLNY